MYDVLVQVGEISKETVISKAETAKFAHRTPQMCEKLIVEVRGYDILS